MRLGYLVSQYPATSHTFIRREVAALRRVGLDVSTFAVRQPHADERATDVDRAAFAETWYILPPRADLLLAHLAGLARPLRYARTLRDALRHRPPGARGIAYAVLYFGEAVYLTRALRRAGVQHLHNHFANAGAIVGMLAARHLGIPWSLTLHGLSEFEFPAGLLLGDKLRAADFAACASYFTRSQAMRHTEPDHWPKLFVSRCGVELASIDRASRTRPPGGPLRLLCVARLSPEKGLAGLVEAFAALRARGVDAELRIVGDGPERHRLRAAVVAHGVDEHCALVGRATEDAVAAEIADADVLVMSSFMEGLPVVLVEALARGVAVVAPRVAGIPELVDDGETGLLFTPSHWGELAAALAHLAADPALRERLGAAGRERVRAAFDVEHAVAPLVEQLALQRARVAAAARPPTRRQVARRLVRDGLAHAHRIAAAVRRRAPPHAGRLLVVTFHRVLPEALRRRYPYPGLAVTPDELAWFLRALQRRYTCGTLAAMAARLAAGDRPAAPLLAVTFDDGQLDNVVHGLPVLRALGVPATFFVPAGHLGRGEPIWHDRLGFAVLGALRTARGERALRAVLARAGCLPDPAARLPDAVAAFGKTLDPAARTRLLDELDEVSGGTGVPDWAGMMSPAQLAELARGGHEIGSHAMEHVSLPRCTPEERDTGLTASRRLLSAWSGTEVASFCYPNGDCDEASARAVERAGYARAVTTRWGSNGPDTDPFRLLRCDIDAARFRGELTGELSEALLAYRLGGRFPGLGDGDGDGAAAGQVVRPDTSRADIDHADSDRPDTDRADDARAGGARADGDRAGPVDYPATDRTAAPSSSPAPSQHPASSSRRADKSPS